MEGACNGGMLYHEVQESKLCAVHCVNTVLQGPFFSEFDLAALASDLDSKERQMMMEGVRNAAYSADGDFLSQESHNVSLDGDFSIQVLQRALEVWDLQVIPSNSPAAETAQYDPANESAFICHLQDHWFCIRKVNGEWYNFDSLYAAPQHLSKFYLSAYLDSLKGFGWSIFIVRGNFPRECPISSAEAPSSYGQWLSPDDAKRISTSSSNQTWAPPAAPPPRSTSQEQNYRTASEMEDEDLRAAIAASLMDTGSSNPTATTTTIQGGTTIADDGGSGAETVEAKERRSRRSAAEAAVAAAEERRRRSSAVEAAAAAEEGGSRSGAGEAVGGAGEAVGAAGTDSQDGQKK